MTDNKVHVKKMRDTAILPTRAHEDDAGYDLYASACGYEDATGVIGIPPLSSVKIYTGVAFQIPKGYVGLVFARSGLGINKGLTPRNCVGVIDNNYRGEIVVSLYNDNPTKTETIELGNRIAQMVIMPYLQFEIEEVQNLEDTDRGESGLGSSGTK